VTLSSDPGRAPARARPTTTVGVDPPTASVLGPLGVRRGGIALVVLGGGLIVIGWLLPWGAAGAGSVSGLSDVIAPWFRVLVLGSGLLGLVAGTLVGHRAARWGVVVAAVAAVGWSLLFPSVLFLGARSLAGFGDTAATVGPRVAHGGGAYALALGVVVITLGSGPTVSAKRSIWIGSTAAAAVTGVLLLVGLS
jgi:hypothetical protein